MTNSNSISESLIIPAAEPGRRYGAAGEAAINTRNLGKSLWFAGRARACADGVTRA